MGLFSKLFGKNSTKEDKVNSQKYDSVLDFIIIYKGYEDSDEKADRYTDLEDELWVYDCIGTSCAMSYETAKKYGVPLPVYPEYPIIGIFQLTANKGNVEGYTKPLFLSSKKEEVKRFLEQYERTHS